MMLAEVTIQKRGFNRFLKRETLLFFSIFLFLFTESQNYSCTEILSSSEGLSQSTVNCILQDQDGFLWIGTQDGLNIFDGYHFTYYQNQPSDSTSLSNNYILSLCEDKYSNIWVGTMSGGLSCLNKKTGKFQNYTNNINDSISISDNTIWALIADQNGNIHAGTNYGLNTFDKERNCFEHHRYKKEDSLSLPSDVVLSLLADDSNKVWIGTNNGLAVLNTEKKKVKNLKLFHPDMEQIIWSMANRSDQKLILGTRDGIWEVNKQSFQQNKLWQDENGQSSTIWFVMPDNNKFWVGTRKGIKIMNADFSSHSSLDYANVNTRNSDNENIWCFLKDRSGAIWSGSDRGILKIKSNSNTFRLLDNNPEHELYISGPSVNSILIDSDETMWLGTDGQGLNRIASGDKKVKVFTSEKSNHNSISNNRVWSLLEDRDNILWVGTYGGGLNRFDKKKETFTRYQRNNQKNNWISNNRILVLLEDKNGDIWFGTRGGGLNRFDKKTETFEVFMNDPANDSSISSNTVISLNEDKKGNLWVGTYEGGLCLYDRKNNSFTSFKNDPSNPNSISSNNVWSILFDKRQRMWLATEGGLNLSENPGTKPEFNQFTTLQGLASNVIFGLAEDEKGNIWMSTFRGICKLENSVLDDLLTQNKEISEVVYNPFHPLVKIYDESFGLQGNEFNQGGYHKAANGFIYFGGLTGMNYFDPDEIKESDFDPNIAITKFKIFNKEIKVSPTHFDQTSNNNKIIKVNSTYYLPSKITSLKELVLSYRESVFSFDFASLDYTNPEKNQYAYFMEGFDQDWNFVSNQTSATYTNLDPGKYVFRVKGTNSENVWSQNEARLEITITPPFWKTTWFIVLMIVIVLLTLAYSIKRIIQNQKRKAIAEKEKIELQLKTIKNQIDPHFAFNAMNMVGSLVYKGDPDTVYDYFTRFARLIRSTLQDSEKIARTLDEELEFVKNYIEIQKTRFKGKFEFVLDVDDQTDLKIEVPKMIIQTHAENAIKHGLMHRKEGGLLLIKIHQQGQRLSIEIEDNGIGRKKAAEVSKGSTGKGMQIIQQIFTLYNKLFGYVIEQEIIDLSDSKGNATGTKVILTIDL